MIDFLHREMNYLSGFYCEGRDVRISFAASAHAVSANFRKTVFFVVLRQHALHFSIVLPLVEVPLRPPGLSVQTVGVQGEVQHIANEHGQDVSPLHHYLKVSRVRATYARGYR